MTSLNAPAFNLSANTWTADHVRDVLTRRVARNHRAEL